jgi:hypothetical protein
MSGGTSGSGGGALLRDDVMETLCALLCQLGTEFAIFIPMIDKV